MLFKHVMANRALMIPTQNAFCKHHVWLYSFCIIYKKKENSYFYFYDECLDENLMISHVSMTFQKKKTFLALCKHFIILYSDQIK